MQLLGPVVVHDGREYARMSIKKVLSPFCIVTLVALESTCETCQARAWFLQERMGPGFEHGSTHVQLDSFIPFGIGNSSRCGPADSFHGYHLSRYTDPVLIIVAVSADASGSMCSLVWTFLVILMPLKPKNNINK